VNKEKLFGGFPYNSRIYSSPCLYKYCSQKQAPVLQSTSSPFLKLNKKQAEGNNEG